MALQLEDTQVFLFTGDVGVPCFLLFQIKEMKSKKSISSENSPTQEVEYEVGEEPPTKSFRHLNRVLKVKFKEGMKSKHPLGTTEVECYFHLVLGVGGMTREYPLIGSVALDILSIPAP